MGWMGLELLHAMTYQMQWMRWSMSASSSRCRLSRKLSSAFVASSPPFSNPPESWMMRSGFIPAKVCSLCTLSKGVESPKRDGGSYWSLAGL